ncbi:superoxide dismutase [Ni] [Lentisphaerota bacterium ZTH]|nr:superoxide dismutase [Lentisphaerota bacterium]WET07383.1 superoxide dismutase [Ni] [Lentisphaerota bacterium ZTH]
MKRNIAAVLLCLAGTALAHCQLPCGIFNDDMRFKMMEEDIITVQKSIMTIMKITRAQTKDQNQLVRWVHNKDEHAEKIQNLAWYYFLAQRVKPVTKDEVGEKEYGKYLKQLELLHRIIFYAMKTKQSLDLENVHKLQHLLKDFEKVYKSK